MYGHNFFKSIRAVSMSPRSFKQDIWLIIGILFASLTRNKELTLIHNDVSKSSPQQSPTVIFVCKKKGKKK